MSLFKRKTDELAMPRVVMPTWSRRLGAVGDALDQAGRAFRDVVVITEGGPEDSGAMIAAQAYRQSMFRAAWTPSMFRIDAGLGKLVAHVPDANGDEPISSGDVEQKRRAGSSEGAAITWGNRLAAIGALMDRFPAPVRSITVVDLDEGAVVNALVPGPCFADPWMLRSFEFSNDQIRIVAIPQSPHQAGSRRP